MDNIYVEENHVNATEGHRMGDSDVYESFTNSKGELFKAVQQEYGKCVSKVYIENDDGKPLAIGWVFEKLEQYTDSNKKYLHETWITLHQKPPKTSKEYFYEEI